MRIQRCLLIVCIICAAASHAWAVAIPILDPGFDVYLANTLDLIPDQRLPNLGLPGTGSGPAEDVLLLNFSTFGAAEFADFPAGWIASGQKPNGTSNTNRFRCDDCFLSDSGTVAVINSFHIEADPSTQGRFSQTLTGVSVLPNTRYTATIEVSDMNVQNQSPFLNADDNAIIGDPARIILSLSAVSPTEIIDLGGELVFTDITPGGFGPPQSPISGAKELLTLTVTTGDTVPAGDLNISFTAAGVYGELPPTFAASAQSFFDNVTLDATPIILEGDYNNDGHVNALDFVMMRKVDLPEEAFSGWRGNFGRHSSGRKDRPHKPGKHGVPEPTGLVVMLLGAALMFAPMRRARFAAI